MAEDIIAMLETLDRGTLRGLRDRAMLLLGYAGGLRRSEIVSLDLKADQTEDGRGWIEILDQGMLVTLFIGLPEKHIGAEIGASANDCWLHETERDDHKRKTGTLRTHREYRVG